MRRELLVDYNDLENATEDDPLLTKEELARLLHCCERTVMRMVARGTMPPPIILSEKNLRWPRQQVRDRLRELQSHDEEIE